MREVIINKLRVNFGEPTKIHEFSNLVKVQYHKDGMYELAFEVSEGSLQLFLNGTGPIIGDSSLNDTQDLDELLKEISVILSNEIKETIFFVGKEVRKTKFTYKAILDDEVVSLSYVGGCFSWKDLFAKKEVKEILYKPWLKK